jgi:pimeloyl-ACP methyl ester carboxylesterase
MTVPRFQTSAGSRHVDDRRYAHLVMFRRGRAALVVVALVVVALLLVGCGRAPSAPAPSGGTATPSVSASAPILGDFSDDVDIGGGRHLRLECKGSGHPTVLFDAGLGTGLETWNRVRDETSGFARACAYDRAGIGQSSDQSGTKTTEDVVADLRALIREAPIDTPIVYVGHSVSGFSLRLFAGRQRDLLAGEVYVDPAVPHQPAEILAVVPPKADGEDPRLDRLRATWSGWPEPGLTSEHYDIDASEAAVDAVTTFGDLPVVVLTAGDMGISDFPADIRAKVEAKWFELHERLARLSTKGRHELIKDAAHSIQDRRPDAVVATVRELVEGWRANH